jgi:pilus assembly protein Flp/PilA
MFGGTVSPRSKGLIDMVTSLEFLATWLRARFDDERGASLVEYALLVALIAVVCIAAITLLGNNASSKFNSAANSIN